MSESIFFILLQFYDDRDDRTERSIKFVEVEAWNSGTAALFWKQDDMKHTVEFQYSLPSWAQKVHVWKDPTQ